MRRKGKKEDIASLKNEYLIEVDTYSSNRSQQAQEQTDAPSHIKVIFKRGFRGYGHRFGEFEDGFGGFDGFGRFSRFSGFGEFDRFSGFGGFDGQPRLSLKGFSVWLTLLLKVSQFKRFLSFVYSATKGFASSAELSSELYLAEG